MTSSLIALTGAAFLFIVGGAALIVAARWTPATTPRRTGAAR